MNHFFFFFLLFGGRLPSTWGCSSGWVNVAATRWAALRDARSRSLLRKARVLNEAGVTMRGSLSRGRLGGQGCGLWGEKGRDPVESGPRVNDSEIDVDGYFDEVRNISYFGKATRLLNGRYSCLAEVDGRFCRVEVTISVDPAPQT